jgi:hypothetical protein
MSFSSLRLTIGLAPLREMLFLLPYFSTQRRKVVLKPQSTPSNIPGVQENMGDGKHHLQFSFG